MSQPQDNSKDPRLPDRAAPKVKARSTRVPLDKESPEKELAEKERLVRNGLATREH